MNAEPSCVVEEALVSGNNPIPDAQITASSEHSDKHLAIFARIYNTAGTGGWLCNTTLVSTTEPTMYIQVCVQIKAKTLTSYLWH